LNNKPEGKVLLIDGNGPVVKFLKIKMESAGYEVLLAHNIDQALISSPSLKGVRIIALASLEAVQSKGSLSALRSVFVCPVLVYGVGFFTSEEKAAIKADNWVEKLYEPDEFLKALEATLAGTPACNKKPLASN
jgi:DNA-binding response OmpR family regulator